ncbi:MAG: hypothetical protein JW982_09800 [Spirochaetes bacterium]|nr:hypothetical protein [Spirochaetota bacterium]
MRFKMKIAFSAILLFYILPISAVQDPEEDVTKARLQLGNSKWLQLHYFLQTGYNVSESGNGWSQDFTLDTSRLIVNGQVGENIYFFVQTDDITVAENSKNDGGNNVFTKDAYIQLSPFSWLQCYSGIFKVPFTRENIQSDATTLFQKKNDWFVPMNGFAGDGRDLGFMLRGFALYDVIEYRIGAFEGLRENSSNPNVANGDSFPRVSGRFSLNIAGEEGKEEGLYNSANYIGKREVFVIGIGADFQYDVFQSRENYLGMTVDVTADQMLNWGDSFGFQGAYMLVKHNPVEGYDSASSTLLYSNFSGYYAQVYYYSETAKTQVYTRYNVREMDSYENYSEWTNGMTFYLNGHNANFKMEYNMPLKENKDIDGEQYFSVMLQLYI